ncbi:MAG: DUF5123 domain-containing protein, partial [Planctomycetes bacterium]|nr:DUF5123 domain-containing protein [Planctomycetota bacterium]
NKGGGMYNNSSSPILTNCIFSGNFAYRYGGGMYNLFSSSSTLTNCTFSENSAVNNGGGMSNQNSSSPTLINCILWGNIAARGGNEIANDDSSPDVTYCDIQGGYTGTGNIDADPLFVDPGNGDFHLQSDSPCIDKGDNSAPYLPLTDFEGDYRIIDGDSILGAVVDMGVDEYIPFGNYCGGYDVELDAIIDSEETVECSADNSLTLKPGFHAKSGSDFHGYIY